MRDMLIMGMIPKCLSKIEAPGCTSFFIARPLENLGEPKESSKRLKPSPGLGNV